MNPIECLREAEMLQVVAEGRWPGSCDPELREHAANCSICVDLIEVAVSLSSDRDTGMKTGHIPGSGVAWWRIQTRLRQEAMRTSQRAVTFAQAAMIGLGVIVAVAALRLVWTPTINWTAWFAGFREFTSAGVIALVAQQSSFVILVSLATLTLVPLAAYFVLSDD